MLFKFLEFLGLKANLGQSFAVYENGVSSQKVFPLDDETVLVWTLEHDSESLSVDWLETERNVVNLGHT